MSSLPGYWALRSEPPRHIPPRTSPALPRGARCVLLGYGAPMDACSSQALGQLFGSAHSGSSVHKMPVPGPPSRPARHATCRRTPWQTGTRRRMRQTMYRAVTLTFMNPSRDPSTLRSELGSRGICIHLAQNSSSDPVAAKTPPRTHRMKNACSDPFTFFPGMMWLAEPTTTPMQPQSSVRPSPLHSTPATFPCHPATCTLLVLHPHPTAHDPCLHRPCPVVTVILKSSTSVLVVLHRRYQHMPPRAAQIPSGRPGGMGSLSLVSSETSTLHRPSHCPPRWRCPT